MLVARAVRAPFVVVLLALAACGAAPLDRVASPVQAGLPPTAAAATPSPSPVDAVPAPEPAVVAEPAPAQPAIADPAAEPASPPVADPTPAPEPTPTPTATPAPPPLRAVFFGSSTTEGVGASDPSRRWTAVLSRHFGWTEVNRGLSGSTLTDRDGSAGSAEARWRSAVVAEAPDVVVVQYGANDVVLGVPLGAPGVAHTFRNAALQVLVGLRTALPAARIYVVEPQPMLSLSPTRAAYDAALAEAAAALGLPLVRAGSAFPAGEFAADWIHLNDAGHAALAAYVAAELEALAP